MSEPLTRLGQFLQAQQRFIVLNHNRHDPSRDGPFEAWAYQGPLDFDHASSLAFGVGHGIQESLEALASHLKVDEEKTPTPVRQDLYVAVDDRELATILAGLRFHQAENLAGNAEIATSCGTLEPLSAAEIDQLCERLNTTPASHPTREALHRIHDVLYLDLDRNRDFYNPDKSWDADTTAAIAEIVAEVIPRPEPADPNDR